jgi:hypothetical protein
MVWNCLIVRLLLWLYHIQSLANDAVVNIAIWKVGKLVLPRTPCLSIVQILAI